MKWTIKQPKINPKLLSDDFGISFAAASILVNKGIKSKKEVFDFLFPNCKCLADIKNMKDMESAATAVISGIKDKKKFAVYGDYDADGITSTVILCLSLKKLGANTMYYIPNRHNEGYGLNKDAILKLYNNNVDILITCDNGISATDEIKYAKSLGMTVIVTDHHEPRYTEKENGEIEDIIPPADFVVDPKQKSCKYPFKEMCAGGISYRFAKILFEKANITFDNETDMLSFAAIATVCDIVDLNGENRFIAKEGIKNIKSTNNIGLNALIDVLLLRNKDINEYHIGNIIGPCINATGRLEDGSLAVSLFLAEDKNEALSLANYIKDLNAERKRITDDCFKNAVSELEKKDFNDEKLIFFCNNETPESIAGIVAGRLKEKYYRPSFVLTCSDNVYKCSSRSIETYNIFDELLKFKNIFLKFGGHSMAAGFSIAPENLAILKKGLLNNCKLIDNDFIQVLRIEKQLTFDEINFCLCDEINSFRPFGKGNNEPLFASKKVEIKNLFVLNKGALKFMLYDKKSDIILEGIMFNSYERFKNLTKELYNEEIWSNIINGNIRGLFLDIVYTVSVNEFNEKRNIQLNIKDLRYSI